MSTFARSNLSFLSLAAAVLLMPAAAAAQSLDVRVDGDRLRIAGSRTPFLAGQALQRLRDGASVNYVFRLSLLSSRLGGELAGSEYRFVISYDIFEETFQVSRVQPSTRVVSHLTMSAAQAALLEAMELPVQTIRPDRTFWIRLEFAAEEMTNTSETPAILGGLVEIFSRKTAREPMRGVVEAGPLRLQELQRAAPARGGGTP